MIHARKALIGGLRRLVEGDLGLSWDGVQVAPPEEAPKQDNGRRNMLGKWREQVLIEFSGFKVVAESPEEAPPLGRVLAVHEPSGAQCSGVLDSATWADVARFIKARTP